MTWGDRRASLHRYSSRKPQWQQPYPHQQPTHSSLQEGWFKTAISLCLALCANLHVINTSTHYNFLYQTLARQIYGASPIRSRICAHQKRGKGSSKLQVCGTCLSEYILVLIVITQSLNAVQVIQCWILSVPQYIMNSWYYGPYPYSLSRDSYVFQMLWLRNSFFTH